MLGRSGRPTEFAEDCSVIKHRIGSIVVALALSAVPAAWADSLVVKSTAEGKGITYNKVKVLGIEGESLMYRTSSGNDASRPLSQVSQITLDDEPAFNDAEVAYLAGDFSKAADGYQKTVRATSKEWLKDRSAQRLVEAAGKAGRFDAAVTGYVTLVARSPELATASKPAIPEGKSTFLDTAVKEVEAAMNDGKLKDEQKVLLLSFALELHRARGDNKAAGETAERLLKLSANDASNPAAAAALADLKINLAMLALDEKNYAKALTEIEQNRAIFTEPSQQVEALYIIARAKDGQAAGKADEKTLKDLSLAYMRVVAHGKDVGSVRVPESLAKTAGFLEQLKQPAQARELYQQVATAYPKSPVAAEAKAAVERLAEKK
jgi:TolA-binding protein